jgi:hypothetical protein
VVLADFVFPAFAAAYGISLAVWPAGLLALASEVVVFRLRERRARLVPTILVVVAANFVSAYAGVMVAFVLPNSVAVLRTDGQPPVSMPGPSWRAYACASFLVAYVLSCVIEYGVMHPLRRRIGFVRLRGTVVVANAASYGILAATAAGIWLVTGHLPPY